MRIELAKPEVYVAQPQEIWTPPKRRLWIPSQEPLIVERTGILVSIKGIVSYRERPYARVIGHPDFCPGFRHPVGDILYVSIPEACKRIREGETAEIHWAPDTDDEKRLAPLRRRILKNMASDPLSKLDGWSRTD